VPADPQPRQALTLPAQISKPASQRERNHDQNKLPRATVLRLFVVIEQVIEIPGTRGIMRIDAQRVCPPPSWSALI